jgi:cytochrome c biogenesis protein CcdA
VNRRTILALVAVVVSLSAVSASGIELLFFFDKGCPQCIRIEKFLTGLQGAMPDLAIRQYEVQAPGNFELLAKLLGVYDAQLGSVPMVFVGDVAMIGDTFYGLGADPVVYSGVAQELVLEDAIRAAQAAGAASPLARLPATASQAVLFTTAGEEGAGTSPVEQRLLSLVKRYPELGVVRHDVADPESQRLFEKLTRLFGARGDPPALFVGDAAVVGDNLYLSRREPVPFSGPAADAALDEAVAKAIATTAASPLDRLRLRQQLTLGAVVVGAALDSINPCEFAVLVLLLGTLLVMGKRVKVVWAGLAFAAGIFVAYFAMGFILYSVLGLTVGTRAFREPFILAVSSLAILVGLWQMKDLLWYGKWFTIEVPERWKPSVKRITTSVASVPGAFLIGLANAVFLAPCTSGPYIVILTLLSQTTTRIQGALWLVLYNLIFILPMIAISLLVHFGFTSTAQVERWRTTQLGKLHFTTGLVMFLLGIGMIVGVRLGYL